MTTSNDDNNPNNKPYNPIKSYGNSLRKALIKKGFQPKEPPKPIPCTTKPLHIKPQDKYNHDYTSFDADTPTFDVDLDVYDQDGNTLGEITVSSRFGDDVLVDEMPKELEINGIVYYPQF